MTLISNDPSWWPSINANLISSYFSVAGSVGLVYDWVLTFGQEVELVWRQHWSLMTVLYLGARYLGIVYAVIQILGSIPTIPVTDAGCLIMYLALNWANVVVFAILGVITITRLHAMYQRSRKVLILLVVVFLATNVVDAVVAALFMKHTSGEALILSDTYQCSIDVQGDALVLDSVTWIVATVWEVLALCLAAWIAVKHFRELRRQSGGGTIENCFTVLMKAHVLYFASFLAVSCFQLVYLLSTLSTDQYSTGSQIYAGIHQFFQLVQIFVLGPRLILSIREYHARLVVDSDAATAMTSIAFQQRVHVSTGSDV